MVGAAKGDKAGEGTANGGATPPNPEIARKIAALRTQLRESFGKIVMAMMMVPRYRHQSLADLSHLVLDPMLRDRIAIAAPGGKAGEAENPLAESVAFAFARSESILFQQPNGIGKAPGVDIR
jgi:hypothetical protein